MWWWIGTALAGGFEVAQQGAIAGGTGHAGVARTGDPALAWSNPAALADGGGARLGGGLALAAARIDARSLGDEAWETSTETPLGTPPHLYASYASGSLLGGVAVNTAFAGGVRWPADSPLRFASIESSPTFVRVAPFVGAQVGRVRVAGGVHVDAGSLFVYRATDHVQTEGTARILLRGAGVGPDASVFVELSDDLGVGIAWKGRTRLPLQGEADFDVPAPLAGGVPDQGVQTVWALPDRVSLGARYDGGDWRAVLDGVWTGWSINQQLALDFADPVTDDVVQVNGWRDSVALRGGGEVDVDVVTLRGGGYVDGVSGPPGPESTLGPTSPDGVRVAGTLGVGVQLGDVVRLDAFGEHLRILARQSTSPTAPLAAYRGRATIGGLTGSVAF